VARKPVFHPLRVGAVERLTDDAVALTFDVPPELAHAYRFAPGQHVNIRTGIDGDDVRRSYSICSPAPSGDLRVAVKRLPGGAFSTWANRSLRPGDVLEVMTPTGHFSPDLDPARARHYGLVGAGSGITPLLSIAATVLEIEPDSTVTLVYGNRTARSAMFLDELADLKDRFPPRLRLLHLLSREPQESELLSGRLDRERFARLLDLLLPPDTVDDWYLCGPFDMVQAAREELLARGVAGEQVHAELFHVDPVPRRDRAAEDAVEGATVTITFDGRATTFALPPDVGSILEAALVERADAPYACRGGVCGTCRARLVEGEVDMATNYALRPDDVARGFVLACQSLPRSDRVVLDFDA